MNRRYRLWARFGRPLKDLEFRFNHPDYWRIWTGQPTEETGPRSARLCDVLDAISGNWFHD